MIELASTTAWVTGGGQAGMVTTHRIQALQRLARDLHWAKREPTRRRRELRPHPTTADSTTFTWTIQLGERATLDITHWTTDATPASYELDGSAEIDWIRHEVPEVHRPTCLLPHSTTSRLVWYNRTRLPSAGAIRRRLTADRRRRGKTRREARARRQQDRDSQFAAATGGIPTTRWCCRVTPLGPTNKEFWHKVHLGALRPWTTESRLDCTEAGCAGEVASVAHVLWHCPVAQETLSRLTHAWGGGPLAT